MEVLHRSRDDQSNVVLSCSQIFYRKIFNGKSFISSLWPLAPERNAAVMMIKINCVVTRYSFTLMLVTAVNLCTYQYLMYSLSSSILHYIYNVSTDACIISIMSRVFTVFLLLYIYMSASFICHLVSACTGVRCRIYVLITAIGYLRRCSEDCRDREITPPMIHRFAAN